MYAEVAERLQRNKQGWFMCVNRVTDIGNMSHSVWQFEGTDIYQMLFVKQYAVICVLCRQLDMGFQCVFIM